MEQEVPTFGCFQEQPRPKPGFFDLSNLPVGETLQNLQALREGGFAVLKSLPGRKTGSLHYVLSLPFLFFGGKNEILCMMTQVLVPGAPLCHEVSTLSFSFPTPCAERLSLRISAHGEGLGLARGRGRGTGCSDPIRLLFIVSMIGLNEEGRNWPGWQSRLIRHFLSAPYPSKTSG